MKMTFKTGIGLSLFPQIFLVKWIAIQPEEVSSFYSTYYYQKIALFLRTVFGDFSFSIGDLLYGILILLLGYYLVKNRNNIVKDRTRHLKNILFISAIFYFLFHISWGLNYYKTPIATQLKIAETRDYNTLVSFTEELIVATNKIHIKITQDSTKKVVIPYTQEELIKITEEGYRQLALKHPFLNYSIPSVKESSYSALLSYMGYAGYLNPFTNEAHYNGLVPNFRLPVIIGHEIGHQIGYAAENETNLIGYLVTANNENSYFRYTGYAYALGYCLSTIKQKDPLLFETLINNVNSGIVLNYKEMTTFWKQYDNPTEPIFKWIFGTFLKANNQKKGIKSYADVVYLMAAYHEKHPLK